MGTVLVVADDLTGANAAAAGFARSGMRAVTAGAATRPDVVAEMVSRFDVVVASIDCRHETPEVARQRLVSVVRAGWPAELVCNRVDTTLRGNLGATTSALLDEVRATTGERVVVLCAPAHPAAGRHTVGGTQLLGGRRLEETEVARDARTPVTTSDVAEVLRAQADLEIGLLDIGAVTGPVAELHDALRRLLAGPVDVVVSDAMTEDHLDRVAVAAVEVGRELGIRWVTCDPGPGSVALARAMGLGAAAAQAPVLAVSGSATELTRAQLAQLAVQRDVVPHRVPTQGDSAVPDVDRATALLDELLEQAEPGATIVLATVLDESDLRAVSPDEAERIPRALATAVRRNLERHAVDGVYSTGGDVTAALLAELGSTGLEVTDEVMPLAVAGGIVGGPWDGLPMVTKGGLVGDASAAVTCLDHLRASADRHRRQVAAAQSRTPM